MFYTRPKIPPLNIDLVSFEGGGSCPAQFEGMASDGRALYVRYRDGTLQARLSDPARPDQAEMLVDQEIGPAFHGDILLEQACDLLGLTVRGATLQLAEEDRIAAAEESWILDWSGQTTYWEEQVQVTRAGGERFVAALRAAFREVRLLTVEFEGRQRRFIEKSNISECSGLVKIGINPNPERLRSLLTAEAARLADSVSAFDHAVDFKLPWDRPGDMKQRTGHEVRYKAFREVFGGDAQIADPSFGFMRSEFATDDPTAQITVARVQQVIDSCFRRGVVLVGPDRSVLGAFDETQLYSADLVEWCQASEDHYLGLYREDIGGRSTMVGVRPAPTR